jgi:hypothetical protein
LDPLVGFTAIQGIGKELQRSKILQGVSPQRTPNQLFIWNRGSSPFAIWAAGDVGNPEAVITNIYSRIVPALNEQFQKRALGQVLLSTNRSFLHWMGLPIVVPFLEPGTGKNSSFLVGGLFPMNESNPQPAPKELLDQLNQKSLVYYDWEITQARMSQYRPLWQLNYMLRNMVPVSTSPSETWIGAVGPKLQNTVTQATLENPHRLKLVRQSQTGFNALELILLAHLLDPNDIAIPPAMGAPRAPGQNRSGPARRVPPSVAPKK